jgi:glyoxylase-like metal-dependent hydrolase (beta-lactamase superfamily II)
MTLEILSFETEPLATNTYMVWDTDTKECAIIDPGLDSIYPIKEIINKYKLKPTWILLTHSHWDHISGLAQVKKDLQLPIYVHELDAHNVRRPGADKLPLMFPIEGVEPDHFIKDGDNIKLGKEFFEVIHLPGHSPGGVGFYNTKNNMLISGDTLFQGSMGNLSFPECNPKHMWESLKKLAKLPKETRVYPGHGEATTIGNESWLSNAENIFGNR